MSEVRLRSGLDPGFGADYDLVPVDHDPFGAATGGVDPTSGTALPGRSDLAAAMTGVGNWAGNLWGGIRRYGEETGRQYGDWLAELTRPNIVAQRGGVDIPYPQGLNVPPGLVASPLERARAELRQPVTETLGGQTALGFAGSTIGEAGEAAAAAAAARSGLAAGAGAAARSGLIRDGDLDAVLPVANRRVGPYQEGVGTTPVAGGEDWTDLDMTQPIGGLKSGFQGVRQAWDNAVATIRSWSPEQATALDQYLADHPEVGPTGYRPQIKGQLTPQFWEDTFDQPQRMRYWYELGTRHFQNEGLAEHPEDLRQTVNVMSGTSPGAEPLQNAERTIGVLAENQQGVPIATDLRTPGSVRMALGSGMEAPKTGNYTGTFTHIAGVDDKPPISVNDRQVAEVLGIDPGEMAKDPGLYALTSHFFQNLRDAENAARPGVGAGTENPFETWQIQAPVWTQWRGLKEPSKIGVGDDYAQVAENTIKPRLEAAGVDTSPGLYSREVLGNPLVPNLVSPTRQQYLSSPTATVETATTMTPEGRRATDLLARLPPASPDAPSWANQARYGMESVQRQSMRSLAAGGVIDRLIAPVLGISKNIDVGRIDTTGWGTYQNGISPNLRIPMWAATGTKAGRVTLSPDQVKPVISALGDAFGQEGTPASSFEPIAAGADTGGGLRTYSVFVPEYGGAPTSTEQLQHFRSGMGDHEISVSRAPNGTRIDIHPAFSDTGMVPPSRDQVAAATTNTFGSAAPVHISEQAYTSHYIQHPTLDPNENYDTHINGFWEGQRNADQLGAKSGRVGASDWSVGSRFGDFEAARDEARAIAREQQTATARWADKWQPRIEKWEQNPAGRGRQLAPIAGLGGAALLGGAAWGSLANPAQAAQPPPGGWPGSQFSFAPVEHDPFAAAPQ